MVGKIKILVEAFPGSNPAVEPQETHEQKMIRIKSLIGSLVASLNEMGSSNDFEIHGYMDFERRKVSDKGFELHGALYGVDVDGEKVDDFRFIIRYFDEGQRYEVEIKGVKTDFAGATGIDDLIAAVRNNAYGFWNASYKKETGMINQVNAKVEGDDPDQEHKAEGLTGDFKNSFKFTIENFQAFVDEFPEYELEDDGDSVFFVYDEQGNHVATYDSDGEMMHTDWTHADFFGDEEVEGGEGVANREGEQKIGEPTEI